MTSRRNEISQNIQMERMNGFDIEKKADNRKRSYAQ